MFNYNKLIHTLAFTVFSFLMVNGQQVITGNTIILDAPDQGDKVYMADERIEFLPGYSFEASASDRMEAYISPYGDLFSSADFASYQLDPNLEIGTIQGAHQVTESGGFAYNVPIELPHGANGMTPQLSITYNSQAGNGILGMGWSLQGLSMISRTVKPTCFQDEDIDYNFRGPTSVNTNYEDAFALDGQLLIGMDGDYGYPNATYATEVENYTRIVSHGTQGQGPEWFEIVSKDGMIIRYGSNTQSRVNNYDGTALIWLIDYIEDQNGNFIIYEYEEKSEEILLSSIRYSGNVNNGTNPPIEVKFDYSFRKDPFDYFIDHKRISNKHIIKSIRIIKEGNVLNKYEFQFGYDLYTFLSKISLKVNGLEKYNPLIFKYGEEEEDVFSKVDLVGNVPFLDDQMSGSIVEEFDPMFFHQSISADLNGDGLTDFYRFSTSRGALNFEDPSPESILSIYLNKGDNEFENIKSLELPTNIILNRGRDGHYRGLSNTPSSLSPIDFDGDGKQDILYFELLGSIGFNKEEEVYETSSNRINSLGFLRSKINNGSFDMVHFTNNSIATSVPTVFIYNIEQFNFQGDFIGNGITDILFAGCNSNESIFGLTMITGDPSRSDNIDLQENEYYVSMGSDAHFITTADFVYVIDFNGDGKSDVMAIKNDLTRIFTFEISEDNDFSPNSKLNLTEIYSAGFPTKWHEIKLGDFNGDGKTDILTFDENQNTFTVHYSTGQWFLEEEFSLEAQLSSSWRIKDELVPYDLNGDGKTDFVHLTYGINASKTGFVAHKQEYLSNGNNFKSLDRQLNFYTGEFGNMSLRVENRTTADQSFLLPDGNVHTVLWNEIEVIETPEFPGGTSFIENSGMSLASGIGDFNGDGSQSLMLSFNLLSTVVDEVFGYIQKPPGGQILPPFHFMSGELVLYWTYQDTYQLLESNPHSNSLLLDGVKNGLNITKEVEYNRFNYSEDVIETNELMAYPLVEFVQRMPIVDKLTMKDHPQNMVAENHYVFKRPVIHQRGKGFLGFTEVIHSDLINEIKSSNFYTIFDENTLPTMVYDWDQNHFSTYLESSEVYSEITEELISKTEYIYEFEDLPNRRRLQFLQQVNSENFITEITENRFDVYNHSNGNLESRGTGINGNEYSKLELFTYGEFASPLGLDNKVIEHREIIVKQGENMFDTKIFFDYNNLNGNLIEKINNYQTPFEITEEFEYDVFGNTIKSTTKASGHQDRISETQFDNRGRLPIKTTNELGQEATFTYHPIFDKPISITDADGLVSTSSYDNFGNLTSTIDKYGIVSTIQKEWVNTNPSVTSGNPTQADDIMYMVTETRQGEPDKTIHYNRLGQQRMQEVQGLNDPIFNVSTYNNKGQVIATTEPFFQGAANISISETDYDDYDRIASVTINGQTVNYLYEVENGLQKTTTINPDGTMHIAFEDAGGNLIKSIDNGGLTEYSYFSHGGVKEIKVNSEVVATSEYDILGRQTKLIDVNAGTIEYTYNTFGEVIETINANGEVKAYIYDDFGRLLQTNNNGIVVDYEYIETGNGINNVEKISTADHEQTFEYDGLNRVIKTTEIINGSSFDFEYVYNSLNQVTQIIYPNGLVVNNSYDNNGYLIEVQDQNMNTLWEGIEQDAFGRYVTYKKGDGITTELYFDAFQNLAEIEAGNVQHHVYNWSAQTGNLMQRQDLIKNLYEEFQYDNLNRLTKAQDEEIAMGPPPTVFSEVEYESNGNISYKSDAGEYAYHPTKPNAVTGVSNDNLNISLLTQDITYNAFNKAETIEENGYELAFLYGYDKQRRKTSFSENGALVLEKYFVGLYEKEFEPQTGVTRHINYISAGDGMTAIVLQEEENGDVSPDETYFTYKDHLGSIVALTDESGDIVLEQSFDSWGRYRNPNDWTFDNILESPTWLRGYTGHEHLPHFDLINMNGRIYDPILGRMLTPDRFVQDPLFSQSYNRYSYCWNNPLRYTDPSGEIILLKLGLTYLGGAITNNWDFNPLNWDFSSFDTYVGMGAGYLLAASIPETISWMARKGMLKGIQSGILGGSLNAMYEYESGQSLGQTALNFGAGFVGGYAAAYTAGAAAMTLGGAANIVAGIGTYSEEDKGYEMAQRFVGGALVTYASVTLHNQYAGYFRNSGDYLLGSPQFSKALTYPVQNIAQRFAYTDKDYYMTGDVGLSIAQNVILPAFSGLVVGGMMAGVYGTELPALVNEGKTLTTRFARLGLGFTAYSIDYMTNTMLSGYNPFQYSGLPQKAGIGTTKSLLFFLLKTP